jgi:hypothetical protein
MNIDYITMSRYLKINDWASKRNINVIDSLFPNQIIAKSWLIDELKNIKTLKGPLKIEIVGSWFGWPLADFLFKNFDIQYIKMYDIDNSACLVAKMYSRIFKVEYKVQIINQDYWKETKKSDADIVINCSSEHMKESFYMFRDRYPMEPIFVIQSNNMFDEPSHINCCNSLLDLIELHNIEFIHYGGELEFNDLNESGKYKRFMVIGTL